MESAGGVPIRGNEREGRERGRPRQRPNNMATKKRMRSDCESWRQTNSWTFNCSLPNIIYQANSKANSLSNRSSPTDVLPLFVGRPGFQWWQSRTQRCSNSAVLEINTLYQDPVLFFNACCLLGRWLKKKIYCASSKTETIEPIL